MGAEHRGDPTVQMERGGRLLCSGFHVDIDQRTRNRWVRREQFVRDRKRIVRRQTHVDPSKEAKNKEIPTSTNLGKRHADTSFPGGMRRKIGWPADWFRRILQERDDSAISIDVISQRDRVDPESANGVIKIRTESRAVSEILRVGDDQIGLMIVAEFVQMGHERSPPGCPVEIS